MDCHVALLLAMTRLFIAMTRLFMVSLDKSLIQDKILCMSDSSTIKNLLADFSQKLSAISEGADVRVNTELSATDKLQEQINLQEAERITLLRARLGEYIAPLTQDIEEDEENLLKAYKLYCQANELNQTAGDRTTHLKNLTITSPLCQKSEYTSDSPLNRFAYLRLWFLATNPDAFFVPEIIPSPAGAGFLLDFIDVDMWKPTLLEKEIMQL